MIIKNQSSKSDSTKRRIVLKKKVNFEKGGKIVGVRYLVKLLL